MEQTLIIAKPDAVQRGIVGTIITRLEQKGLKLIGMKMVTLNQAMLRTHYAEHVEKSFYTGLEQFMSSSPVVLMAWEGQGCIDAVRAMVGVTNPRQAAPGTIRGDFAMDTGRNLIHASDSVASGQAEVSNFFEPIELMDYDKSEYLHVYEDQS